MSAPHKYDYIDLERQYIQGDMSIRQLCRDNDIKSFSAVAEYARNHEWGRLRDEFRDQLREKETKAVTSRRADALARAIDDAVIVSNKAIYAFSDSLEDRWVENPRTNEMVLIPAQLVTPLDFTKILEKLQLIAGQPTKREAHVGVSLSGELEPSQSLELLRDVAAFARERGAGTGTTQSSPLPRIEGARKVN